jgi:hypothetical protein
VVHIKKSVDFQMPECFRGIFSTTISADATRAQNRFGLSSAIYAELAKIFWNLTGKMGSCAHRFPIIENEKSVGGCAQWLKGSSPADRHPPYRSARAAT